MRVGIAAGHGGFGLKEDLGGRLAAAGHDVVDFGVNWLDPGDDYPDFVTPLARAVASGKVERGVPFAEAEWELRSASTKFPESAQL